jgi:purine-binding chemotaxis protein CheW
MNVTEVFEAIETIELPEPAEAIDAIEAISAVEAMDEIAAVDRVEVAEAIEAIRTADAIEPVAPVVPFVQPETAIAQVAPVPPAGPAPVPVASPPPPAPKPMNAMPLPVAAAPAQSPAVALLHRLANHEVYEQPEHRVVERATRWLRMRCDQQHYAVELLKIQEVVLPATLLPLRGAATHVLGVMNLRGQIVPVIDLGLYLGRQAIVADASTRIVVIEEHGETLGLRVSAVEDVAKLTDAQIETPESTRACGISGSLFRGVSRTGGLTLILLDATSILK